MKTHISIDMGAKNNGVFLVHTKDGKIIDKTATNYIFEPSSINFLKKDRTEKRHQRRGFKRAKFARRLLDELLNKIKIKDLSQNELELIYGLLKNRGFNYINIEFENDLSDESLEVLNEIDGYEFKGCVNKDDYELRLSSLANDCDESEFCEFLAKQVELITQKDENGKDIYKIADKKSILQMFEALRNEMLKNNKHRERYLKDIKDICESVEFKSVFSKLNIKKDEFINLIGNISNYQTRVLRKYFNNKFDDVFDDEKLKKVSIKNINFLSFKGEKELENKHAMLKNLKNSSYEYLCKNDPITSIPPYERMNNKNPQTCYALVLKDNLSQSLKNCLKHILDNPNFSHLNIDEYGVIKDFDDLDEDELKTIFQRFLDVSKASLDDDKLYPRDFDNYGAYFKEQICLNDSDFKVLKDFVTNYYDELLLSKKGILKGKILKSCGCHTPYKNNSKHVHLSILWGVKSGLSKDDVKNISDFINNKENKIGKSTLKGFLGRISEGAKDYQNSFYKALKEEQEIPNDKDLASILKGYELAYTMLKNLKEFKNGINATDLNAKINLLLQTANIIFDEQKGFHKLCYTHAIENLLRISGEKAMCSVLGSDSARLINGRVEMYIDRLAYEIVSDLDLSDTKELSINIEQNAFTFETAAKELTKTKVKRKPKEYFVICPYSGEPLNLKNAEFDHILPRSKCEYNSEANLIAVKSYENLRKSNGCVYFDDLHENYKKDIFKKCGVTNEIELKSFINDTLNSIDMDKYTNYKNLKAKEQIAFRHALFMPDESFFKIALELLKKDKRKTSTNGTQKRLARLIVKHAMTKNNELDIKVNFIDSKLTSAIRRELSIDLPEIAKEEKQSSHSHCIDASVVFYIASAIKDKKVVAINENVKFEPKFKFSEIYLKESEIKNIQSQKYLELSQDKISRKQLFKDTIYSLRYENAKALSDKHFGILKELDLLMEVKKLKSTRFHINTKKVFDLIFASFEAKDIKTLEKIKFLDKFLVSSVRKDILSIFFDDKKGELIKPKDSGANIEKFYEILVKNGVKDKSEVEKIQKLYIDSFYTGNQKDIKRARNKRRVTYSLSVVEGCTSIIRRNYGYDGMHTNSQGGVKAIPYVNAKAKEVKIIPFFSKNALPNKISEIITIVEFLKEKDSYTKGLENLLIDGDKKFERLNIVPFDSLEVEYQEKSRTKIIIMLNKNKTNEFLKSIGQQNIDFNKINDINKLKIIDNEKLNYDYLILCEHILTNELFGLCKFADDKRKVKIDISKYPLGSFENIASYLSEYQPRSMSVIKSNENTLGIAYLIRGAFLDAKVKISETLK